MYHWCHLELRKFFGYQGVLNGDTAEEVWNLCNDKLQHDDSMTVRGLIEQSNVAFIGTTDDPIDDLAVAQEDQGRPVHQVHRGSLLPPRQGPQHPASPASRSTWASWLQVVGKEKLACINCVTDALTERIEFFAEMGCRASDHGLDYMPLP